MKSKKGLEQTPKGKDGHPNFTKVENKINISNRGRRKQHSRSKMDDKMDAKDTPSSSRFCATKQYQSIKLSAKQIWSNAFPSKQKRKEKEVSDDEEAEEEEDEIERDSQEEEDED